MSFDSIAATSEKSADTFRFSEQDRELILSQIATSDLKLPLQGTTSTSRYQQLESLKRKELTLTLHASTLAEYVRVKRIPRGLRTHLTPNLLTEDTTFTDRWYGLCNQLSLDLMLLSIKHLQDSIDQCKDEIRTIEQEIRDLDPPSKVESSFNQIEESMSRLRESIMKVKLSKFARDTQDYANDEVYTWNRNKRPRHSPNPAPAQRPRNYLPPDTTATDSDGSGDEKGQKRSFLGLRRTVYPDTAGASGGEEPSISNPRPLTRAQRARGRGRGTRRR